MRKGLEEHEQREITTCYKVRVCACAFVYNISLPHLSNRFLQFGVLYCRAGQKTENEFYANDTMSADFEEFLNLIGHRIELAKHTGFRYCASFPLSVSRRA